MPRYQLKRIETRFVSCGELRRRRHQQRESLASCGESSAILGPLGGRDGVAHLIVRGRELSGADFFGKSSNILPLPCASQVSWQRARTTPKNTLTR